MQTASHDNRLHSPRLESRPGRPFIRRLILVLAAFVGIMVLMALAAYLAQSNHQRHDPQSLFYSAIKQNLTETGITCTTAETTRADGGGGGAAGTTKQSISLDLSSRAKLRSTLTYQPTADTSLTLSEIDLPGASYVRYDAITTSKKNSQGQLPDFSHVLHVWSKTGATTQPPLYGRTALGNCVLPLAHLTTAQAARHMSTIQTNNIFKTDFKTARQQTIHNRAVEVYTVSVQARPYIDLMKQIATDYGLQDLASIKASDYDTKPAEAMTFYIGLQSGRVEQIISTRTHRSVVLSDFGKTPLLTAPQNYITADELQKRFEVAQ